MALISERGRICAIRMIYKLRCSIGLHEVLLLIVCIRRSSLALPIILGLHISIVMDLLSLMSSDELDILG